MSCWSGGGHAHALADAPVGHETDGRRTPDLVSSTVLTPYSGMLPGLIAGTTTHADVHIDLARVCQWAGVRFIASTMTDLDLQSRRSSSKTDRRSTFDVVSLDTGSTPDLSVPGSPASQCAGQAGFVVSCALAGCAIARRCHGVRHAQAHGAPLELGVVGSGAGGFELVVAMRHSLPSEPRSLPLVSAWPDGRQRPSGTGRAARRRGRGTCRGGGASRLRCHRAVESGAVLASRRAAGRYSTMSSGVRRQPRRTGLRVPGWPPIRAGSCLPMRFCRANRIRSFLQPAMWERSATRPAPRQGCLRYARRRYSPRTSVDFCRRRPLKPTGRNGAF